jgi:uncharacterized protein (TIGR04255 family)
MPNEKQAQRENILSEALLEIRFNGAPDLSLLVGKMDTALHEKYPTFVNLNIPDFPTGIPNFDTMVRYRMFSEDKSKLFNLGKGVLSINTVDYSNFANFIAEAKIVLENHRSISGVSALSRIGLRYINKISIQNRKYDDLFKIDFKLPESLKKIEAGFSFQTLGKINMDILSTGFGTEKPFSKETVILDFDYYCEQSISYDLNTIEKWATRAKNIIVENFRSSLTESYYQSLQKK